MRAWSPLTLVVALALAACGGGDDTSTTAGPSAGAAIPGGGLSVQGAIDSPLQGPLMVAGYLIERDGELRLCDGILESSPPQCGEPSLRVDGDPGAEPGTGERVSVLGAVEDGTITVSETSLG